MVWTISDKNEKGESKCKQKTDLFRVILSDAVILRDNRICCTFVDLYRDAGISSSNVANYMVDGFLQPNYAGMDKIIECLVNAMLAE